MIFCKHKWAILKMTKSHAMGIDQSWKISEYLAERILLGLITVLISCEKCGAVKVQEMLGE